MMCNMHLPGLNFGGIMTQGKAKKSSFLIWAAPLSLQAPDLLKVPEVFMLRLRNLLGYIFPKLQGVMV